MLRERYLGPREKPDRVMVWRPAAVPMPNVAVLCLDSERHGRTLRDWRTGAGATVYNAPQWEYSNAPVGPHISLVAGSSQYVEFPDTAYYVAGDGPFTISMLVDCSTSTAAIVATTRSSVDTDGYELLIAPASSPLTYRWRTDGATKQEIGTIYTVSEPWQWLTMVLTGDYSYHYNTGVYAGRDTRGVGAIANSQPLRFCRRGSDYYTGKIAAMYIWKRALSSTEVALHVADPYMWFREPRRVYLASEGGEPPANWYIPNKMRAFRNRRAA